MVKPQEIYNPMYLDKEKFIILITGGRASGKSFNASTFIERLTFELQKYIDDDNEVKKIVHNILYTRYTMTAANISVIPEFLEKIEADGTQQYFQATRTDVTNTLTGSRIMFRGIKTSSGNQTAKLKSIHGITTFVCDEAEEWTNEQEFDTIALSIRQKGIQNRVIIIMNPTDSNHFIYQKYIKDTHKLVEYDGVPVQISTHPNVLHIHTTYLDNRDHLSEQFIREVEEMKANNPEKYAHVVMGRWSDVAEGAIFKKWGIVKEFPQGCRHVALGVDYGYTNDVSACVKVGVLNNDLYVDEVFYKTYMGTQDLIKELKAQNLMVYSESADPRLVDEIAASGVIVYPIDKSGQSIIAGIEGIKDYDNIFVTERSYNIQEELRNYTWDKDKDGHYINQPIDKYNHACFIGSTLISTNNGYKRIDEIKAGDLVLTPCGYKRVMNVFDQGIRKVGRYEIKTTGASTELAATKDHKIKTTKGWMQLQSLAKGDKIYLAKSLMEKSITYTKALHTFQEETKNCTLLCGNITTAQYLKATMCTIKIATLQTISCLISNLLAKQSTYDTTQRCASKRRNIWQKFARIWRWLVNYLKHGTQAKKGKSGIGNTASQSLHLSNQNYMCANGAKKSFIENHKDKINSALMAAKQRVDMQAELIISKKYAPFAEKPLNPINICKGHFAQSIVQELTHKQIERIESVQCKEEWNEQVYDLEIEDVHEYFANGVLVHNCDAMRYWYLGKMLGKILRKKETANQSSNITNYGF